MGIKIVIDGIENEPALLYQFQLIGNEDALVLFDTKDCTIDINPKLQAFSKFDYSLLPVTDTYVKILEDRHYCVRKYTTMPSFIQPLQFLLLFFIEGASYIDSSDPKWMLYTVHSQGNDSLIGFCTVYRFFKFPAGVRARISQFFVLPTHQRKGYGAILYSTIMKDLNNDLEVKEVAVESPAEGFNCLKIKCDCQLIDLRIMSARDRSIAKECTAVHHGEISEDIRKSLRKRLAKEYEEYLPKDRSARDTELTNLIDQEILFFKTIIIK